jgi:hypothetical protein
MICFHLNQMQQPPKGPPERLNGPPGKSKPLGEKRETKQEGLKRREE